MWRAYRRGGYRARCARKKRPESRPVPIAVALSTLKTGKDRLAFGEFWDGYLQA